MGNARASNAGHSYLQGDLSDLRRVRLLSPGSRSSRDSPVETSDRSRPAILCVRRRNRNPRIANTQVTAAGDCVVGVSGTPCTVVYLFIVAALRACRRTRRYMRVCYASRHFFHFPSFAPVHSCGVTSATRARKREREMLCVRLRIRASRMRLLQKGRRKRGRCVRDSELSRPGK